MSDQLAHHKAETEPQSSGGISGNYARVTTNAKLMIPMTCGNLWHPYNKPDAGESVSGS